MPSQDYERRFWLQNQLVAGIDEAGRGALAGPVFAAAVILRPHAPALNVNDSKLLKHSERLAAEAQIQLNALAWSVASASVEEIEHINILQATFLAMHRAISSLNIVPNHLLIDGNRFKQYSVPHTCIVKGDSSSESIAAASILAKTARDRFMSMNAHKEYPEYGFDKHKGYGTMHHRNMLLSNGACALHRVLFLRKIFQ